MTNRELTKYATATREQLLAVVLAADHHFKAHVEHGIRAAAGYVDALYTALEACPGTQAAKKRGEPAASVGDRLRFLRERRGLTQVQAAAKLGISASTLRNWEQKRSVPMDFTATAAEDVLKQTRNRGWES